MEIRSGLKLGSVRKEIREVFLRHITIERFNERGDFELPLTSTARPISNNMGSEGNWCLKA